MYSLIYRTFIVINKSMICTAIHSANKHSYFLYTFAIQYSEAYHRQTHLHANKYCHFNFGYFKAWKIKCIH